MEQNIEISKLSEKPELYSEVLNLLENEFEYDQNNSFEIDFHPLLREENSHNNFILYNTQTNEVIGHIGTKPGVYNAGAEAIPVLHLGAIVINKKYQGKGHFREFFEYILNQLQKRYAFLFLWSEKQQLYNKFGFSPIGGQIQGTQDYKQIVGYQNIAFNNLSDSDLNQIKLIYEQNQKIFFMPARHDWSDLLGTKSCKLFVKKENEKIISYYIKDKGQDLNNIIHEFGITSEHFDSEIQNFQKNACWMPYQLYPIDDDFYELQYTALYKLGNPYFLPNFVKEYTREEIQNFKVNQQSVSFIFNNRDYECSLHEFFEIMWGPQIVKEFFARYPGLYIPGIESI